jgi:hypothetical protein
VEILSRIVGHEHSRQDCWHSRWRDAHGKVALARLVAIAGSVESRREEGDGTAPRGGSAKVKYARDMGLGWRRAVANCERICTKPCWDEVSLVQRAGLACCMAESGKVQAMRPVEGRSAEGFSSRAPSSSDCASVSLAKSLRASRAPEMAQRPSHAKPADVERGAGESRPVERMADP